MISLKSNEPWWKGYFWERMAFNVQYTLYKNYTYYFNSRFDNDISHLTSIVSTVVGSIVIIFVWFVIFIGIEKNTVFKNEILVPATY